ncbi:MAG: FAD-dependent oxidoreductase [Patescibacteria group bacterium]|nr:FAD-dependent oxidoreductase [Patescibacteria group bacterium]
MKKIVIVGAGFAGLSAALRLEKKFRKNQGVSITLVSKEDYHLFVPNLFEVATAEEEFTSVSQIKKAVALPVREILHNRSINFIQGILTGLDENKKQIKVGIRAVDYDYLVLALGNEPDFSSVPGASQYAYGFHNLPSALRLRNALEFAVESKRQDIKKQTLRFVIAGGGFAAVKLAGELQSFLNILAWKYSYPKDRLETVLVEGARRLMGDAEEKISRAAYERLQALGVRMQFHHHLSKLGQHFAEFLNGEKIQYEILIWALKSKSAGLPGRVGLEADGSGGVAVDENFMVRGARGIFALGSLVHVKGPDGRDVPQTYFAAKHQGEYVAGVIFDLIRNRKPEPYVIKTEPFSLRVGGKWAIFRRKNIFLQGYFAYLAELLVHFLYYRSLVGFRKAWKYLYAEAETLGRND